MLQDHIPPSETPELRITMRLEVDGLALERGFDLSPWDRTLYRLAGHEGGVADKGERYQEAFSNEVVGILERMCKEELRIAAEQVMG